MPWPIASCTCTWVKRDISIVLYCNLCGSLSEKVHSFFGSCAALVVVYKLRWHDFVILTTYSRVPNKRTGRLLENEKMRKNPTYTHLFGTIRLLIFSKKSHLYVYCHQCFYSFLHFHIFFFMFISLLNLWTY